MFHRQHQSADKIGRQPVKVKTTTERSGPLVPKPARPSEGPRLICGDVRYPVLIFFAPLLLIFWTSSDQQEL